MLRISACVITKNEENNIGQWLEGVKPLASEIIVVDTGSEDRTVELAKAAGAEVYFFPWCGDFSAAKNFALDQATGDWIVFLDADEIFSVASIPKVRQYIEKFHSDRRIVGIICQLLNIDKDHDNRLIDTAYQMRVFRNEKSLRYIGEVHEMICSQAIGIRKLQLTDLTIYHTGYSSALVKKKCERNLVILQEKVKKEGGEKPAHYPYFTDIYMGLGDYEKVIHYAELTLKKKSGLVGMQGKAYRRLLDAMNLLKKSSEERLQMADIAIAAMPEMPEFLGDKGMILAEMKRYEEAKQALLQALALRESSTREQEDCMTNSMDARLPYLYVVLGKIYQLQGCPADAFSYFVKALRRYPYQQNIFSNVYQYLRHDKPVDVITFLDSIYDTKRDLVFLVNVLRQNWAGVVFVYYVKKLTELAEHDEYAAYMAAGRYDAAVVQPTAQMKRLLRFGIWSCWHSSENEQAGMLQVVLPERYRAIWKNLILHESAVLDDVGRHIMTGIKRMEKPQVFQQPMSAAAASSVVAAAAEQFGQGRSAEAVRSLLQAYEQSPDSPLLAYGLASLLQLSGERERARKILLTVRSVTPEIRVLWKELQADPAYPLVSILIPTYNRPGLFELTLRSACMQTYTNVEIIVCDNSTDDRTETLMSGYQDNLRVRYVRNRNAVSKAENFQSFEDLAQGEFLQWCMDDDILGRDKLAAMVAVFQKHPEVKLVTSIRGIIDAIGQRSGSFAFPVAIQSTYQLFSGQQMGQLMLLDSTNFLGEPSAVLFRREDMQHHYWQAECRGYKTISDVVMWLELLAQGPCVVFREPLSYFRQHDGQEGKQSDVVLLSRMEWCQLIREAYEAGNFLHTKAECSLALKKIHDEYAHLSALHTSGTLADASADMWKNYEQCIMQIGEFLDR